MMKISNNDKNNINNDRICKIFGNGNTYTLVNGTSSGIYAALFAVTNEGDNILVARNCTKSVSNAIELRHLNVNWMNPDIIANICIDGPIDAKKIEYELENSDVKYSAVVITSPTIEGVLSDVHSISTVCRKHGVILIVDESYGAHFSMDTRLPIGALPSGADIVIHSLSGILDGDNQTALMHVRNTNINIEQIDRYCEMFDTKEQSPLLVDNINNTIEALYENGKEKWNDFFSMRMEFMLRTGMLEKFHILSQDELNDTSFEYLDPCKIVVSLENTAHNGVEIAERMRNEYNISPFYIMDRYIVFMTKYNTSMEDWDKLAQALVELDATLISGINNAHESVNILLQSECSVFQALNSEWEEVDLMNAIGRVSADYITIRESNIPIILPGERFVTDIVDEIRGLITIGINIEGIHNGMIRIIKE